MNASDITDRLKRDIAKLSKSERRRAVESVRNAIRAMILESESDGQAPRCCPRCGSVVFVKKGRDARGRQRHLCRDCGRTFGPETGHVMSSSKLASETWMAYAECFVLMLPLRECSMRCGISLKTSFAMRHRLIACLEEYVPRFDVGAGDGCEIDETYFPESFKGNHTKGSFRLPRPARHRGGQVRKRGLSREQICVVGGTDDKGTSFLEMSGRGIPSVSRITEALRGKVSPGATVATDGALSYPRALDDLGVAKHEVFDPRDRSRGTINHVNNLHSLLSSFLSGFRGVSTKRLPAYLSWFLWCRSFMRQGTRDAERTVARQMADGTCADRVSDLFNVEPPYMDYWRPRAA